MWYLTTTLIWWLLAALALGVVVGWFSCRHEPRKEGIGWVGPALVAFIFGLFVCALTLIKGRAGLWFDTAMLFAAAYFIGCCIGCLLGRKAVAAVPAAVVAAPVAAAVMAKPAPVAAAPAAIRPYQWQAAKDGTAVTLTGYVPSDDVRGKVVSSAKTMLAPSPIVDKLQVGAGAPAGLDGMTNVAFGHLAKLDKGIASLIDTKYTLTGVAGTQPNYDGVMGTVKALPAGFSLAKVDIVAPPAPKVAAPAPKPVVAKAVAAKPAPAPVAVKAPEPAAAPKIDGEDKVPGKRPAGLVSPRGGVADDLKRIKGIGRQNEGRLHGLGIWHFDQIASWVKDEALWVGSYLAFPGRIEREEWIKQAKTLAAGKQTEFSKRVAKGKVATSQDDGKKGQSNVEVVKPMRVVAGKAPAKATKPKK
jgi:predicted flap endonuclease-1-like 5' DNA nuclease